MVLVKDDVFEIPILTAAATKRLYRLILSVTMSPSPVSTVAEVLKLG